MTRTKSKHLVTLLKLSAWSKRVQAMMIERKQIDANTKMEAGFTPLGIIEKDGYHYLIDHEGVGSYEPLEREMDFIEWYEHTYSDGKLKSINLAPTARSNFTYDDLVKENVIGKKKMRLDTFIRVSGGSRLEGNYTRTERFLNGELDKNGKWIKQELKTT